jgi:CelD/BcsL family acetyltransferase involved in cellulose biosynthesis
MPSGFEAYAAGRRRRFARYFRDKERSARALLRDHGEADYDFDDRTAAAFDWLIARKREQYRESARPDVFACGWTVELLRALRSDRGEGVEGRLATLRVGGRVIAAEYSLRAGERDHLWIPAFDPAYRRYSPGALLTLSVMRAAAEAGVRSIDFGADEELYKQYFADPAIVVFEGACPTETSTRVAAFARNHAPGLGSTLARLARKAERRWYVITACEPDWPSARSATLADAASMLRRRMQPAR